MRGELQLFFLSLSVISCALNGVMAADSTMMTTMRGEYSKKGESIHDPLDAGSFDKSTATVELAVAGDSSASSSPVSDDLRQDAAHAVKDPIEEEKPEEINLPAEAPGSVVVPLGMKEEDLEDSNDVDAIAANAASQEDKDGGVAQEEVALALQSVAQSKAKNHGNNKKTEVKVEADSSASDNKDPAEEEEEEGGEEEEEDEEEESTPPTSKNEEKEGEQGEEEVSSANTESFLDLSHNHRGFSEGAGVIAAAAAPKAVDARKANVEKRIQDAVARILAARARTEKAKNALAQNADHIKYCREQSCLDAFRVFQRDHDLANKANKNFEKIRERTAQRRAECARKGADKIPERVCRNSLPKLTRALEKSKKTANELQKRSNIARERYHKAMADFKLKHCKSDACKLEAARNREKASIARHEAVLKQIAEVRKMEIRAKEKDAKRRQRELKLLAMTKAERKAEEKKKLKKLRKKIAAAKKRAEKKRREARRRAVKRRKAENALADKKMAAIIRRILHIKGKIPKPNTKQRVADMDKVIRILRENGGWGRAITPPKDDKPLSPLQMKRLRNYYSYFLSFSSGVGPWW